MTLTIIHPSLESLEDYVRDYIKENGKIPDKELTVMPNVFKYLQNNPEYKIEGTTNRGFLLVTCAKDKEEENEIQ